MKQCSPLSVGDLAEVILDLRLEYGDTDEYFYILQDSDYARIVQKYHCIGYSTMSRTVGMAIAMKMSHTALRERVGQEERYGKEAFDAFMSLLTKKLKDPAFGMLAPLAYFGGTYRCESEYYAKSNEFTWQPFYRGSETYAWRTPIQHDQHFEVGLESSVAYYMTQPELSVDVTIVW